MNKFGTPFWLAALFALFCSLTVLSADSAHALESPPAEGMTVEAGFDHGEAAWSWGSSRWEDLTYFGGARFHRLALDTRVYGGANLAIIERPVYAMHLQAAGGPRMALRDRFGAGLWSALRARGVWQWSRFGLHTGLFVDGATEFNGLGGWRLRPGADLGVGLFFDPTTLWLNLNAGYTLGGQGPGGLHLGGSLGLQW